MTPAQSDHSVAALLQEFGPALLLYARTWAGRDEAEDVVQAVFVRLLTSKRWPAEPRPWLFRCVRNEAISWRRSIRRRLLRERKRAESAEAIFESRPGESFDSSTTIAASYLRLRDDVVRDGWDALPPGSGGGNVEPSATVLSMQ